VGFVYYNLKLLDMKINNANPYAFFVLKHLKTIIKVKLVCIYVFKPESKLPQYVENLVVIDFEIKEIFFGKQTFQDERR
jgi:hypothetical protein